MDGGGGQGDFGGTTCRYGASSVDVRGPATPLETPYGVVLGGCLVYGRWSEAEPFAARLAARTGRRIVNLGVRNAGPDVFVRDEGLLAVAAGAELAVIQTLGAHGLSNRFYTVHPRRNDRFLRQSDSLAALYPDVDFSDFAFVRHLLHALRARCPDRFEEVAEELRLAWVARMRQLTSAIAGRRILLDLRSTPDRGLGADPFLVTGDMIGLLRETVDDVVTVEVSASAQGGADPSTLWGDVHEAISAALAAVVGRRDGLAA